MKKKIRRTRKVRLIRNSDITVYLLKKSGILMDCSFTLLVGVFGVSSVGTVPPAGFLVPAVVPPFLDGAMPRSSLAEPVCAEAVPALPEAAWLLSKLCVCCAV